MTTALFIIRILLGALTCFFLTTALSAVLRTRDVRYIGMPIQPWLYWMLMVPPAFCGGLLAITYL